jgi:magnesium transporter
MSNNIIQTKFKKFTWYNVADNQEEEISWLRENFDFSPAHLRDCATPPLRPKIETFVIPAPHSAGGIQNNNYVFLVILFPIFNRQTRAIASAELDVFIGKNYLVTVHKNEIPALRDLAAQIQDSPADSAGWPQEASRYREASALELLLSILEEMTLSLYPMLNHVAWDIDEIDKQLFSGQERTLLNSILNIKRNIVDIRKACRSHSHVFSQLNVIASPLALGERAKQSRNHHDAFSKLISHSADIWEQLENHKATIDAIQETNESLISFQISDVMKTLTIFSVIIFPLTLIAAIFGMDAKGGMPFVNSPYGFWKAIAVLLLVMLGLLYYFKKKRWL